MNFKGGLLLDESVNLGDISTSSFGTPLPAKGTPDFDDSLITQPKFTVEDEESEDEQDVLPPSPLDGGAPLESAEADEDAAPPSPPERHHTGEGKALRAKETMYALLSRDLYRRR